MAGRMGIYLYLTDASRQYVISRDKGNAEAGGMSQVGQNDGFPGLPYNIQPRYALYLSTDKSKSRRVWFPTRGNLDVAPNDLMLDGGAGPESFKLASKHPEKTKRVRGGL